MRWIDDAMTDSPHYILRMTPPAHMSADELLQLDLVGKRTELVRGRLVVQEPAGFGHGAVASNLAREIACFVRERDLGQVLAAETGFKLASAPDTVRAPDVSFVSRSRVPYPAPAGYASLAPDLVVEVLSPSDRPGKVLEKVGDWLTAGTRLVWVVDPMRRQVRVYRADGGETLVESDGVLDGEDVLVGFRCGLGSVMG